MGVVRQLERQLRLGPRIEGQGDAAGLHGGNDIGRRRGCRWRRHGQVGHGLSGGQIEGRSPPGRRHRRRHGRRRQLEGRPRRQRHTRHRRRGGQRRHPVARGRLRPDRGQGRQRGQGGYRLHGGHHGRGRHHGRGGQGMRSRRRLKDRHRRLAVARGGRVGNPRGRLKVGQPDLADALRGQSFTANWQEVGNDELAPAVRTPARLSGLRRLALQHVSLGTEKLHCHKRLLLLAFRRCRRRGRATTRPGLA